MRAAAKDVDTKEQIASVGTISASDPKVGEKISDAMEVVQALQPNADVRKGMAIASDHFDEVRDDVIQFVQSNQG